MFVVVVVVVGLQATVGSMIGIAGRLAFPAELGVGLAAGVENARLVELVAMVVGRDELTPLVFHVAPDLANTLTPYLVGLEFLVIYPIRNFQMFEEVLPRHSCFSEVAERSRLLS